MRDEYESRYDAKRQMSDKSRIPRERDDARGSSTSGIVEVMRKITEEVREEVVQAIRESKAGSE